MGICIAGVAAIVDGVVLPHKVPSIDVINVFILVLINPVACAVDCKPKTMRAWQGGASCVCVFV
jgi:hypothetical protein